MLGGAAGWCAVSCCSLFPFGVVRVYPTGYSQFCVCSFMEPVGELEGWDEELTSAKKSQNAARYQTRLRSHKDRQVR
jgi:hypothetical protein